MKKIKLLSHREFIYINRDTPDLKTVISYLVTIGDGKIKKLVNICKKKSKQLRRIIRSLKRKITQSLSQNPKKKFPKKTKIKKHSFVPQPLFSSYQELSTLSVNKSNQSGYWGEHIVTNQLKDQGFSINTQCKVENPYGDIDIIAYKKTGGKMRSIQFHEVKTLTRGCSKESIDLTIDSQMRHLLSHQQRKGGETYIKEVLVAQEKLKNTYAKTLLLDMKSAKVQYFLHKIVIDKKGRSISSKRQSIEWTPLEDKSVVMNYLKTKLFLKNK